jgi:pimeloyl-ACP methyl ester carboxylesterase
VSDDAIEHRFVQLDGVRLHVAEAHPRGRERAPLVVLLHGFPEFWYSWRHQLAALSQAGFHVVAPDMRGYGDSDKPRGVASYRVETLADDVDQLVRALGHQRAVVVGHDWGGMVAWFFAMRHAPRLDRLVIMNAPHPAHMLQMALDPEQVRRSWYILFFQLPMVPERKLAHDDYARLRRFLARATVRPGAFSDEDTRRYADALAKGGRAPFDYYRALLRRDPFALRRSLRTIDAPVQVIWGAQDRHLGRRWAEPPAKWVWDCRVDPIEDASHWVQVDRPERVNELLFDFLAAH